VAGRRSMVAVELYTAHKKNKRAKEQAERRALQSVFKSCRASQCFEPVSWAARLAAAPDVDV
jgi:hypothetical protein